MQPVSCRQEQAWGKHPQPDGNSTQSGFVLCCSPASLHICSEHTACPPKTTYRGNHREVKQEEKYPKREFVQEKKMETDVERLVTAGGK